MRVLQREYIVHFYAPEQHPLDHEIRSLLHSRDVLVVVKQADEHGVEWVAHLQACVCPCAQPPALDWLAGSRRAGTS